MEPVVGIEPTTDGLQNRCSTAELNWHPDTANSIRFISFGKPPIDYETFTALAGLKQLLPNPAVDLYKLPSANGQVRADAPKNDWMFSCKVTYMNRFAIW